MTPTAPWALSQAQIAVEALATIAFALSGVIEGARKRLHAVGICVVAALALGLPAWVALLAGGGTATLLRALALYFDWKLPVWQAGAGPGA